MGKSREAVEVNKFYYEDDARPTGRCAVCGREIKVAIFKDTPWCSENHRKVFVGEKKAGLR